LIIILGTYGIQPELKKIVPSFRSLLDFDDVQFNIFSKKVDNYFYSFIPNFLIAIPLFFFSSGGYNIFKSFSIISLPAWLFIFLIDLITATGVWMGFSIWIAIFLISRSPLKIDFSQDTINKFRGITKLALLFSLFYFLALSLGMVIPLASNPSRFIWDLLMSPAMVLILLGVLVVMLPFYNIHSTLLTLKRRELENISADFVILEKQFNQSDTNPLEANSAKTNILMMQFFSLQIRERKVRLAQEWPIDITFVSRLLILVLVPVVVRIVIWTIMGLT